ncbi:hypothetical protein BDA96_02G093200 [Sorghum bicolor]|uniref:Uncharacterized protein n=1 Tax=Sorghum bicolor TaxID=4558 RepID=A0A921RNU4_SORBI|nr:hypothetical protein BDA96_02G093200 [Sorghum bicolor]
MDTINLMVCRLPERQYNWGIVMLLWRFWKIPVLFITIIYPNEMVYYQYLMKALTLLPVENLHLHLATSGHAVISCVFHFLTIFTSTRRLFLQISVRSCIFVDCERCRS